MKLAYAFLLIALFSCNAKKEISFSAGGYAFVKDSTDLTFPYYPIKKLINPRDSFSYSYYTSKILQAFDEPNISISPASKPEIRMTYEISVEATYILDLYEDSIIVKKSLNSLFNQDEQNLTKDEWFQMEYLNMYFPLERNERINSSKKIRFRDSIIKAHPQINNPAYYIALLNKFNAPPLQPFRYSKKVVRIAKSKYYELVDDINKSGYWKFPLWLPHCKVPRADGSTFILEINTGKMYNNVGAGNCVTGYKEYSIACQKILDIAEITEKEITVANIFIDE